MKRGERLIFERTSSRILPVIAWSLAAMLAALLGEAQPANAQQNRTQPSGAQNAAPARAPALSLAPVLKKITPAVVSIETKFRAPLDAKNRRRDSRDPSGNVGSGVVFDASRGLILTNNHVIDRAYDITVTFTDGRMFKAKRVGTDPEFDLAVIAIDADSLPSIPFGNSRELEVGDFVLAIGYPANIGQSVTSGIVSGLHRTNVGVEQFENFIQTDAAIYPGNSGGALVNLQGDLVGINTAFIGATSTNPGMGFAIPVNTARIIADQIIEFGDVRRGTLGFTTDDPSPDAARAAGPAEPIGGAVIAKVTPGSSAARAGLKPGDLVTELGGRQVTDSQFLRRWLALLRVGEVADLTVRRDGKSSNVKLAVADRDPRARAR
jgi:serine protease Do/serine protease DegQ